MPDLEEELSEELSAEGSQKSFNKEESSSTGSVESVGQFLFQLEDVVVEESDEEKEGEVAPLPEQGGIWTGNNDRLSLRSFSSQASSNMLRRTRVPSITIRRTSVATGGPAGAAGRRQSTSGRRKRTSSASSSDEEENAGRRMSQVAGRRGSTLGSRRRSSAIKPNFEVSFNRPAAPAAAPFGLDDVDNDVDILISSSDESEYSDSASEVDDFDSAGDPECSDESIESDDSSNESFDMKIRNMASPKAKPSLVRAAQTVSRVLGVFKSPKMSYSLKDEMSPKPVPENKTRLLKKNMEATGEEQDRFENVLDMLGANADEEAAIPTRKKVFASRVPRGGAAQESAGDEFAANADPTGTITIDREQRIEALALNSVLGLFDGVLNEGDREQDDDLFDRHLLRKETAPKTPEGRFAVNPSGDSNECDYEDEGSGSIGGLNSRDLDSIAEESLHGGGSFYSQVGAAADISGQVSQLIANSSIISAPSDDKDSPPLDDEKSSPSDDEIAMPSDDEDDEYSCDSEPKSGISAESSHEVQSGRLEFDTPDNSSSAGGIGIAEHASNSASADLVEEERSDVHDDHNEHDGLDAHDDYDGRNDHDDHNAEVDAEPTEGAAGSSTGRRGRFSRWDDLDAAIDLSSDEDAEPWRQEEESVSDDPSASEGDADDDSSLGQFDLGD